MLVLPVVGVEAYEGPVAAAPGDQEFVGARDPGRRQELRLRPPFNEGPRLESAFGDEDGAARGAFTLPKGEVDGRARTDTFPLRRRREPRVALLPARESRAPAELAGLYPARQIPVRDEQHRPRLVSVHPQVDGAGLVLPEAGYADDAGVRGLPRVLGEPAADEHPELARQRRPLGGLRGERAEPREVLRGEAPGEQPVLAFDQLGRQVGDRRDADEVLVDGVAHFEGRGLRHGRSSIDAARGRSRGRGEPVFLIVKVDAPPLSLTDMVRALVLSRAAGDLLVEAVAAPVGLAADAAGPAAADVLVNARPGVGLEPGPPAALLPFGQSCRHYR